MTALAGAPLADPRHVRADALPLVVARAEHAWVWDEAGTRYLDLSGAWHAQVAGHRPHAVCQVLARQADMPFSALGPGHTVAMAPALAGRLAELAPWRAGTCARFLPDTSAAVEAAVRMARLRSGRRHVVSFAGAQHGSYGTALALSGRRPPFVDSDDAFALHTHILPYPHTVGGVTRDETQRAFVRLFASRTAPEGIAAIVVEPIQPRTGIVAAGAFMDDLRRLCDDHGIALIADETATAPACTGKTFAIQHFDIEPDMIVLGPALAAGLPGAALIARAGPAQPAGVDGESACSTAFLLGAQAMLELGEGAGLASAALALGRDWLSHMQQARARGLGLADPRGLGAVRAITVCDRAGRPDPVLAARVHAAARARGVLTRLGDGGALVFHLPAILSTHDLHAGLDVFFTAMQEAGA